MRFRPAIRALIVDPDDRVLLVRFEFPDATVWAPPGGGIEPGEDPLAALRRELTEEVGLLDPVIGPPLWARTHVVPMGGWDGQRDEVRLVRTAAFTPAPRIGWRQLHTERVHELRWWTLDELVAAQAAMVRFAPFELPELVAGVLRDGPPAEPPELLNIVLSSEPAKSEIASLTEPPEEAGG